MFEQRAGHDDQAVWCPRFCLYGNRNVTYGLARGARAGVGSAEGMTTVELRRANGRLHATDAERCEPPSLFGCRSVVVKDGVLITASATTDAIIHQAAAMCRKRRRIVLSPAAKAAGARVHSVARAGGVIGVCAGRKLDAEQTTTDHRAVDFAADAVPPDAVVV